MEFLAYILCLSFVFLTTLMVDSGAMPTIGFVEGSSGDNHYKSCASFVNPGPPLPNDSDDAVYYTLRNLARVPGCDIPSNNSAEHQAHFSPLDSTVVAVTYDNCSAVSAAMIIQRLGGKGLILVAPSLFTKPPLVEVMKNHGVHIPTALIASSSFEKIQELGEVIKVKESIPTPKFYMDYSVVLLWLMAVSSVVLGTFWDEYIHYPLNGGPEGDVNNHEVNDKGGSDDTKNGTQLQVKNGINGDVVDSKKTAAAEKNKQLGFTLIKIVIILIIITAIQVLLYYFYEQAIYGVFAFFFLLTVSSIMGLLDTFKFLLPCLAYQISCRKRSVELRQLFMFGVAVGMYVTWVVLRLERFSWALQDILVLCVIVRAVGRVNINDLKTYSVVLILVTLYFTFMIFGTSSMTPEGKSLMEIAILGRDGPEAAEVRENMPMALRLPQLTANPLSQCFYRESSISLLDIFVPGGMISYCYKFGCKVGARAVYFFVSLIGYGLGLALTFVVQYATRQSQPALLYMTPCILVLVIGLSIIRKEFTENWNGEVEAKSVKSDHGKYNQVAQNETNI